MGGLSMLLSTSEAPNSSQSIPLYSMYTTKEEADTCEPHKLDLPLVNGISPKERDSHGSEGSTLWLQTPDIPTVRGPGPPKPPKKRYLQKSNNIDNTPEGSTVEVSFFFFVSLNSRWII